MRPQPRLPLPHKRIVLAIGVLAFASAACVKQGPPGVAISPLKADIVFGVKVAAPAAAPANTGVSTPEVFDETAIDQFDEKVLEIPDVKPLPRAPLGQTVDPCPAAALTAFPKLTAESTPKGLPVEGVYKFKRSVALTKPDGNTASNAGYEQHVVRRVKQTAGKSYEFSYQVVQPDNVRPGEFVVTTYRVNSNPTVVQQVNRPPQTIGVVPLPGADQVITPPADEPGIFVDRIDRQNKDGSTLSSFAPNPPLKYLPLDEGIVKPGQTFETVGVSPNSGQAIRHTGTVLRKTRVDACGEVLEGWLIEATQTFSDDQGGVQALPSNPEGEPVLERKYFYNVATQLGALFIAESTQLGDRTGAKVAIDLSVADPKPQALPDSLK